MVKGVQKKPSFLDISPCILNNPWTDWANNLGLVSFWRYLTGEYGKLPKWGVGAPRGPHGGPKGSKMAKIDQNIEFSDFCHHPFHSGKDFSIFLHRSNKERVAENGRWEWRPLGAKHGGTTGQKWLKLTKIFDFFYFAPSNSLWQQIFIIFTLILCGRVAENDERGWGPLGGPPGGPPGSPKGPKMTTELHAQGLILVLLGYLGPPGGNLRGPHPRLSFSTTLPHNISKKSMKICWQSELEGGK